MSGRISALVVVCVCAAVGAGTAFADNGTRYVTTNFPGSSKGYLSWGAACNKDSSGNFAPTWKGYMKEFGDSKVRGLMFEYLLFEEATAGRGHTITYGGSNYKQAAGLSFGSHRASVPADVEWTDYQHPKKAIIKTTRPSGLKHDSLLVIKFTFERGPLRNESEFWQIGAACSATPGARRGR